jgi:hypothetical protein
MVVLANSVATGSVVMLGIWKGYARLTRFDAICQVTAFAGLATWPLLHTPLLAVMVTVAVDAIALVPTIRHAWRNPEEEVWAAYALSAGGAACAACALLALRSYTLATWLYPAYLCAADALTAAIIMRKRR